MGTATCLNSKNAFRRKSFVSDQKLLILFGEDVVGDGRCMLVRACYSGQCITTPTNVVLVSQCLTKRKGQRCLP